MLYSHSDLLVPPTILSVSGLTRYLQTLLEEDDLLGQVWLSGEVSSAHDHRSGLFFTLQDPDEAAAIRCVVWNSYRDQLVVSPTPGEQVIVLGRIRVFPQRGEYQLMVWQVLQGGEGLRALRYRQLRDRLTAEGVFDPDRKRPLPAFPKHVAVVTSPQAAAWGDIQRTLKLHHPGLSLLLSPSLVQGELAPDAIVAAIQRVINDGRAEVLILSRGGGATEELACFNDERVVRAIATCPIPVIAGIGHQRDETLADLVADAYAHTPTAAAELAVPRLSNLQADLDEQLGALILATRERLEQANQRLHSQRLRLQRLRVDRQLERESILLGRLQTTLIHSTRQRLEFYGQHHHLLGQTLESLDPKSVLHRGYSLIRTLQGDLVRSATQIQTGDRLVLGFADGAWEVEVSQPSTGEPSSP
jgi:exodeoxyribonuclease VII large subunit